MKPTYEEQRNREIEREEEFHKARMAELEATICERKASTIERTQGQADRTREIDSVIAHRKAIEGLIERQTNVPKGQVEVLKEIAHAMRKAAP